MSEELKTLKDLAFFNKNFVNSNIVIEDDLKQGAIKEVKFAESSKEGTKGLFGWGIDFMFTKDVIEYIKWKFNITEDDLKGGNE